MGILIKEIYVEDEKGPIGLEEEKPRFSWILESEERHTIQTACRILIYENERCVWDSGKIETEVSTGIQYEGEALKPCTAYRADIRVWDNHGNENQSSAEFETGFMSRKESVWEGAQWIGAPRFTVNAKNRGVFVLETEFCLEEGSKRGGVVFGAKDFRLLDSSKNELGLEGENYIRYEVNLTGDIPALHIYRVGYAKEDRKDIPFAKAELPGFSPSGFHKLRIEVDGNNAMAYLDGVLADAVEKKEFWGRTLSGRVLNPRGTNDVLTYPHLNEIGFFAGKGDRVSFKYLSVRNMREPSGEFIRETPEGGLYGKESIFKGRCSVEKGCFVVEDCQITADPSNTSIPMLRTSFQIVKELVSARLYITARGIYDCRVNGKEITDKLLTPGLTQYDKRINYQTYDITGKLEKGSNGIGVTLASGWWSDAQTFTVRNFNYFGDRESFMAKLVLTFEDGERKTIVSNTRDWKYFGEGPYLYSGFFSGEEYDARKGWIYREYSKGNFDDSKWEKPEEITPVPIGKFRAMPPGFGRSWPAVNQGKPEIEGGYAAPVYVVEKRRAKSRKQLERGVYLYDLEQEMAGVPRIVFHEKEGTRVIIRYGEVLYPDMEEYKGNEGKLMLENYRDAGSTDVYICSGEQGEIFQPRFTFHGYRYIEISGVENPPEAEEVESLQYSSIRDFAGAFESDWGLLNRFAENVYWSQKCNFINIPTDCPQRNERMGWAGDTHVFCHTALQNSNLKQFYIRNLQAMVDLQTEEGQFPEIAPIGGGFGGITYECASIFMAWELYQQYGDVRILKRFYPGMKKYMEYMKNQGLPGKGDMTRIGPLGDWLALEETDVQLLWNAFYYREAVIMEKISAVLSIKEDQEEYGKLAEQIKDFWNNTFINPKTKRTRTMENQVCDTQCSYALGLEYGIVKDRKAAGEHLLRKTRQLEHTVGTGFFGTGLLNQALTDMGYTEDAYKLMLQTEFPSWLYPVTQGATTIWERWDSYTREKGFAGQNAMNSFNHYSLGSVLSWIYQVILGIQRLEEYPGYKHFVLKPEIGPLKYAKGSVDSPYGKIKSGWEKQGEVIIYRCEIPVNTTADIYLSDGRIEKAGSGAYEFRIGEDIHL